MKKLGAKLRHTNRSIASVFIGINIFNLVLLNVTDFYLKFHYQFEINTIFHSLALIYFRAIITLISVIFMFLTYNIYIRYQLINERFRYFLSFHWLCKWIFLIYFKISAHSSNWQIWMDQSSQRIMLQLAWAMRWQPITLFAALLNYIRSCRSLFITLIFVMRCSLCWLPSHISRMVFTQCLDNMSLSFQAIRNPSIWPIACFHLCQKVFSVIFF